MNKKDCFLIIICIVIFAAGLCFVKSGGQWVEVTVDGNTYGIYPLDTDAVYKIGDTNRLLIKNGKASMEWADCPDKYCVKHAPIDKSGGNIVCLPNRVSVKITGEGPDAEVG